MKTFVFALTALTLASGGAFAASSGGMTETTAPAEASQTVQVPAGDVMTSRELAQAGLNARDLVTVTQINTSEDTAGIDNSSRGFY
ncbi:hypothetical protein E4L95_20340 [Paracoccus liaowanqingii]|uniref:DUF4148 domain-containing protein n=1 Tax=Paracoccus liaowanqingii TaxID=2560053 RepID=A0A4Z1BH23_9RHOB|nr:hypothetical protein [Paracoccus liaowanqingii]QDA36589.1 hypothetical protein E4191_21045 [Paracoccus liaowanqingii]TGN44112.1 hypothetical protein E4L95_20340 [Paracoccus liaowanqingii]